MIHLFKLIQSIRGPHLYRVYKTEETEGSSYGPNPLESLGNAVVKWVKFGWSFSYWMSPVIMIILYRRDMLSAEGLVSLSRGAVSVFGILILALSVRAIGRLLNSEYMKFLTVLYYAQTKPSAETKEALRGYDFDFSAWPVDFRWNEGSESKGKSYTKTSSARGRSSNKMQTMPCNILSYICAHSFGIRLLYPGCTSLLNTLIHAFLVDARRKLVEEKKGMRAKLLTEDGNEIDTMFVDRRNNEEFPNGNTLVICCEGNAGFYEIGCTATPLEAGYSVLGWNHPGFGGSTGVPYPAQEHRAVDTVMQYAIHSLGFRVEDIVAHGWSIGGYSATWLGINYPDIKFLLLDATFDEVMPLAVTRMPVSWGSLVKMTIKKHMYLNNADNLCGYPGPVLLIRRSRDEMISTGEPFEVNTNRGNFLLKKLLQHRYPKLLDQSTEETLNEWLKENKDGQTAMLASLEVDENLCHSMLLSYIQEHSASYPMLIGDDVPQDTKEQLLLYIASKYMDEFDSNHGTPLPASFFRHPWTLPTAILDSHL